METEAQQIKRLEHRLQQTKTIDECNGWVNYETWCAKLWMDNDEKAQRFWEQQTHAVLVCFIPEPLGYTPHDPEATHRHLLARELAGRLEQHHANLASAAGLGNNVISDLLGSALERIDWQGIAEHMLDEARTDTATANKGRDAKRA